MKELSNITGSKKPILYILLIAFLTLPVLVVSLFIPYLLVLLLIIGIAIYSLRHKLKIPKSKTILYDESYFHIVGDTTKEVIPFNDITLLKRKMGKLKVGAARYCQYLIEYKQAESIHQLSFYVRVSSQELKEFSDLLQNANPKAKVVHFAHSFEK